MLLQIWPAAVTTEDDQLTVHATVDINVFDVLISVPDIAPLIKSAGTA